MSLKEHRHRAHVTGATFDPQTGTSTVFRRCRCGATDTLTVSGHWPVLPRYARSPVPLDASKECS